MDEATRAAFSFPHWAAPLGQQIGFLRLATVLAVLSGLYAVWLARRERDAYPLFVFLGAGLAVIYEPLGDILTKVAYPPLAQDSLITSFGRPIPLWMAPNYFFFFCVPVLLLLQFVVHRDVSARKWFLTYFGLVVFVALFEQPGINADAWRYYGTNQAFSINSYPVWVAFANAQTLVMLSVGISLLRRTVITARTSFLFVLLVPMLLVASHVGPSLFVVSALYSTNDLLVVNLAATLTIVCCLLTVGLGLLLIRTRCADLSVPASS
jgi:hypothetical protein